MIAPPVSLVWRWPDWRPCCGVMLGVAPTYFQSTASGAGTGLSATMLWEASPPQTGHEAWAAAAGSRHARLKSPSIAGRKRIVMAVLPVGRGTAPLYQPTVRM